MDGTTTRGTGGFCLRPLGGGETRCGGLPSPATTCGCTSHKQCITTYGTGAFCATFTPGAHSHCSCGHNHTICAVPA